MLDARDFKAAPFGHLFSSFAPSTKIVTFPLTVCNLVPAPRKPEGVPPIEVYRKTLATTSPGRAPPTACPQEAQNGPASAPDAFSAAKPSPLPLPLHPSPVCAPGGKQPRPRAGRPGSVSSPWRSKNWIKIAGHMGPSTTHSWRLPLLWRPLTLSSKVQLYLGESKSRTMQEL